MLIHQCIHFGRLSLVQPLRPRPKLPRRPQQRRPQRKLHAKLSPPRPNPRSGSPGNLFSVFYLIDRLKLWHRSLSCSPPSDLEWGRPTPLIYLWSLIPCHSRLDPNFYCFFPPSFFRSLIVSAVSCCCLFLYYRCFVTIKLSVHYCTTYYTSQMLTNHLAPACRRGKSLCGLSRRVDI